MLLDWLALILLILLSVLIGLILNSTLLLIFSVALTLILTFVSLILFFRLRGLRFQNFILSLCFHFFRRIIQKSFEVMMDSHTLKKKDNPSSFDQEPDQKLEASFVHKERKRDLTNSD